MKTIYHILTLIVFLILPTTCKSESIHFADGPWTIERKYGGAIKVTDIEFTGGSKIAYTKTDGSTGFTGLHNMTNLDELNALVTKQTGTPLYIVTKKTKRPKAQQHQYQQSQRIQQTSHPKTKQRKPHKQQTRSANIPRFNIEKFCQTVADTSGGSYQIMQGCLQLEREAKNSLNAMNIEHKITTFCKEVAETSGGSYQIMHGCVQMERSARNSLR